MRYRIKKKLSRYQVVDAAGRPVGEHGSADAARLHLKALRTGRKAPTTAAGRRALDDRSFVLSSERVFPITSPQDVKDAVSSWGRYRGPTSFDTFKRNLIDLAQRKGFTAALPASWGVATKDAPAPTPGGNAGHGDGGLFANPALSGGKRKRVTTKPAGKYRSIQNPRAYRALRKAGYSKEAAARISNAQAPGHTVKAPNYNAKRGEVIAGNLVRGDDGKFASGSGGGSGGGDAPKKDAAPKKPRTARQTPEEKRAEREANRKRIAGETGLSEGLSTALVDFADPNEPQALSPANAQSLMERGLVEQGDDGRYRLTGAGSTYVNASRRGDSRRAADALSRAADRRARLEARRQRLDERRAAAEAKRAERDAKREAAAAAPAKGGGGGGGGKKREADDSGARLDQSIAELRRLAGGFGRGKAPPPGASTFTVFKDARGQYRWVARTTTAFEDRDGEVLSVKALAADVARADADGRYGPLRWWHIGTPDPLNPIAPWGAGMDLGMCDFNAMSGRTLIESGTFKTDAIARWAATNADALGLSPGFFHPAAEPDAAGVFHHIRRFERSLAPKERVSNPFTALHITTARKESPVDIAKITTLLDLGLDAATIKSLLHGVDTTEKTADAGGVRYKTEAAADAGEITVNGVTYVVKAPPPPPARAVEEEDAAPAPPAALKEDEMEDEGETLLEEAMDGGDLLDMDIATFRTELRAAVGEALAPVIAQLKMSEKMEGMLKGMGEEMKAFYGGTKTKETAVAAEVAALKARLAELEGDRTALQNNGFRASGADATVTAKAAQLAEASQPAPLSPVEEVLAWTRQTIPQVIAGSPS